MSTSTGGSTDRWTGNSSRTLGAIATSVAFCFLLLAFYLIVRYIFIQRLSRRAAAAALEPPKQGLDPAVIASLPTFTYKKSSAGGCSSSKQEELSSTECPICLSVVDEGEVVRSLPNCNHVFHRECIDVWLDSNVTCPVCRATADPNNPPISAVISIRGTASGIVMASGSEWVEIEGSRGSATESFGVSTSTSIERGWNLWMLRPVYLG